MLKREKNLSATATVRLEPELMDEIDEIVGALFSKRSIIINECIRYGLSAFKKERPDLFKIIEANKLKDVQLTEKKRLGGAE